MRRFRRLTRSDKWDIALLVGVLVLAMTAVTLAWRRPEALPGVLAFAATPDESSQPSDNSAAPSDNLPLTDRTPSFAPAAPLAAPGGPLDSALLPGPLPAITPVSTVKRLVKPAPKPVDYRYYKGQKYRYLKTLRLRVTAYAPDRRCCWPYDGTTTASGASVKTNGGRLVAADTRLLPFNSLVSVPGYAGGQAVPVLDRGGAIKGYRLDVLLPTFGQAEDWGSRFLNVKVYVPVDD